MGLRKCPLDDLRASLYVRAVTHLLLGLVARYVRLLGRGPNVYNMIQAQ